MATEMKTRKYSKEQLISYLEKHGSNLTEAANIAGTNPRTLGRYLSEGIIPSEWLSKIQAALKDRKPIKKEPKKITFTCAKCKKSLSIDPGAKQYSTNIRGLENLGVTDIPSSGWHWSEAFGTKERMYPICEKCSIKLDEIHKARKKTIKGKIATKKSK